MSIVVFYLRADGTPAKYDYADKDFGLAMKEMESLRSQGMTHVCMSSQLEGQVGKPGVASIVDGKTPDGHDYDWTKQGRAGRMRAADYANDPRNGADL